MESANQTFEFSPDSPSHIGMALSSRSFRIGAMESGVLTFQYLWKESAMLPSHLGRTPGVVVAPAIALDDDQVLVVDLADGLGDPHLQIADRTVGLLVAAIALARRSEAPVGFVDQVVAADPRLMA
jgi:hypothetical protein